MSDTKSQAFAPECKRSNSHFHGIVCDQQHQIACCPIPFNGSKLLIDTLMKLAGNESVCYHPPDHQMQEGNASSLFSNVSLDENWLKFAVIREPADRLYAAYIELSICGDQFSHLTFEQFAQMQFDRECDDRFAVTKQSEYLRGFQKDINWLVAYEKIPMLLTVLENISGEHIPRKKVVRKLRSGSVVDLSAVRKMNGAQLRQLARVPNAREFLTDKLTDAISDHYEEDCRLYSVVKQATAPAHLIDGDMGVVTHLRQVSSKTSWNRYPEIFQFVAERLRSGNLPKTQSMNVASIGCSTGEECSSLREYLPNANIHGFDLRKRNLKIANDRNQDPKIDFHLNSDEALAAHGPFDAIFAMSVFCRWPDVIDQQRCDEHYTFEEFQSDIQSLDRNLKQGGLLIIFNAMFRFTDLELANCYQALEIQTFRDSGFVTKFSPDNLRYPDQSFEFTVFQKL